jgi:DNA-binding MarR family transcriptional regulator
VSTPASEIDATLDATEMAAWTGFLRAHAMIVRDLDAQLRAAHGLPLSSYEVLLHLAHAPDRRMRMSALADKVLLTLGGVTRLIDRLEADGLVRRQRCESDRRGFHAVLTDDGLARLRETRGTHLDGVRERFIARLPAGAAEQLEGIWPSLLTPGAAAGPTC